ncbi:hypothetical protein TIFTF001_022250 [Ficus carica]|uniref:Amine oxidase domain-containing protein n=1 Tax=Ficus carica TaxID=3494 RepID=A0AA88AVM3_FICCA|nr:hypothetical protein TIFTF001_022250 [Ficus carica]
MFPIYENSNVLLSWFAGKEALELEQLSDEEIKSGVSATISSFLSKPKPKPKPEPEEKLKLCNANGSYEEGMAKCKVKVKRVLKSQWGNDPLFFGSYSYVAVGSSGDDLDRMAEPLPRIGSHESANSTPPPLQLLFAGEATHRTHYSTTHGAYFSGLREANRLLQHYHCLGFLISIYIVSLSLSVKAGESEKGKKKERREILARTRHRTGNIFRCKYKAKALDTQVPSFHFKPGVHVLVLNLVLPKRTGSAKPGSFQLGVSLPVPFQAMAICAIVSKQIPYPESSLPSPNKEFPRHPFDGYWRA